MHQQRPTSSRVRRRTLRLTSVMVIGAGVALSACGSASKQGAASTVDSAISALGSSSSLNVEVSLGITPAQAQTLAGKSGSTMTQSEATALSRGAIFFTTQTGHGEALDSKQALTDSNNAYDLGLQFGTQKPLELKYVNQNLYLRADANQLLTDLGQSPAKAAPLEKTLTQLNSVVPGISQLGGPNWVEVNHASLVSLEDLLKSASASNGAGQPSAAQIQSTLLQLRTDALNSLKANSTFTSLGTSNGRGEYAMTLEVHNFLTSFGPALQKDLSALPVVGQKFGSGFTKLEGRVPAGQTATAHLYTSGGKLSEIDVDLNQFAGKQKVNFPVPLRVAFTAPPAISAPSGATTLNLSNLPKLLQQLLGGLGANKSASGASL